MSSGVSTDLVFCYDLQACKWWKVKVGPSQLITIENFVAQDVCEKWVAATLEREQYWETRFEYIHTLGSAWYLDIESGILNYYHANSQNTNRLLLEVGTLVETLKSCAEFLVAPDGKSDLPVRARKVNLGPYWVDAGVVISTAGNKGQIHADYEGLSPYPAKLFDSNTRAYSAIISLAKPLQGGNLKIWLKRFLGNEESVLEDYQIAYSHYDVGSLTLFDSFCYHQIMAAELTKEQPFRAVAAMHFLYLDDPYPHWEYWF